MPDDLNIAPLDTEDDDKKIVERIDGYYREVGQDRLSQARAWEKCLRFIRGDQYLQYQPSQFRYDQLPIPVRRADYVPRPITNYTFRYHQALVSNQLSSRVIPTVQPQSDRDEDKWAARISESALAVLWDQLHEDWKQIELESWRVATGTAIKKTYIDNTAGGYVQIPDEEGAPRLVALGDIRTAVLSPFNFAVDSEATDLDNPRWTMEFAVRDLEWTKDQYAIENGEGYTGAAAALEPEHDLNTLLQTLHRLGSSVYSGFVGNAGNDPSKLKNKVVVKECYERPTRKNPEGRCFVVAGGKLLYRGPSPYYFETFPEITWHPYSLFRYMLDPGQFWGLSVIFQITRIQQRMNAIDSMIVLNRKTNAAAKVLWPNGCGIPDNYLTGRPGSIVKYNPAGANGAKPEFMQGASLPADVLQERNQCPADMDFVVGGGDLLRGEKPAGASAFAALSFLDEKKADSIAIVARQYELGLQRSERMKLLLVQKYYQEPRSEFTEKLKARLSGVSSMELDAFMGSDLHNNVEVRIEPRSSMPRSRILQQQTLLELIGRNLLPSVLQDPQENAEFLELFGIKRFGRSTSRDVRKAEAENMLMQKGANQGLLAIPSEAMQDPMAKAQAILQADELLLPSDNNQLHIYVHTGPMKDIAFLSWPKQIRAIFQLHVEAHDISEQQLLSAQQAQAQAMQAAPQTGQMAMGSRGQAMTPDQMQMGMQGQSQAVQPGQAAQPGNGSYLGGMGSPS